MSVQFRKKSSSFTQTNNPNKTINKYNSKQVQLSTCRSVSAFADTAQNNNSKNLQSNKIKQVQKFSIDNYKGQRMKRNFDQTKNNNKINSFVGYKDAIEKRKKKSNSNKKNFNQQLLSTIDTFQQTLCSLPLDKLILSENPFYWIEQQTKTLIKLQQKFIKISHTLKQQMNQYYLSKLQSVFMVIKNIKQNLQTLNKMSLLKNYTSGGTSIQSRNSQSTSSLGQTSNYSLGKINHQKSRYQTEIQDKINQGQNYATQNGCSDNLSTKNDENKENCQRFCNQLIRKSEPVNNFNKKNKDFDKIMINQKDQFMLHEYISSNSESQDIMKNIKTLQSQRSFSDQGDTQKNNKQKVKSELNGFIQNQCYNQDYLNKLQDVQFYKRKNMSKTISKFQKLNSNQRNQFQQDKNSFNLQQNKQTLNNFQKTQFLSSIQFGDETKRKNMMMMATNESNFTSYGELNNLKKQLQTKNQIIKSLESKHQKLLKVLRDQFGKKQKNYLQTIYQFKQECKQKQESIKQLLFERQERSDQFEFIKRQLKQKSQVNVKLDQKLSLIQKSAQTLSNQLRQYKIRQQQLRQTVHLQRQRTKKLQSKFQQIQNQLEQMKTILSQNTQQKNVIFQQKQLLIKELQVLMRDQQKMNQKEEIYKLKYFRLYADFDKFKQKINDDSQYWKKICLSCKKQYLNQSNSDTQKQIELRQLINFHKKRLLHE